MNIIQKIWMWGMIMYCVAAVGLSSVYAASASPKREALKEGEAGIVHVEGDVTIVMPSGALIVPQEGKKLPDGARIQTAKGARLQVGMSPTLGTLVLVEEKSIVTMTPKDNTKATIKKGSVFAVLDKVKPGAKFQFETPRGIAGVRGTVLRIISMPDDKDAILVSEGAVGAFSPDLKELGTVAAGNKGYLSQNQPLFTEPLSVQDGSEMKRLHVFVVENRSDFNTLVGGFEPQATTAHAPQKTGPAGGKSSKKANYDTESGPTGPGGGFMQNDSREFIDNRYMGRYDSEQRRNLDQQPQQPPSRESGDSHH